MKNSKRFTFGLLQSLVALLMAMQVQADNLDFLELTFQADQDAEIRINEIETTKMELVSFSSSNSVKPESQTSQISVGAVSERVELFSQTVGNVVYTIYKEVADESDIHTNPDGWNCYRSLLTLEIIKNGNTESYVVDDNIYLDKNSSHHDGQRPCLFLDPYSNLMYIFINSKDSRNSYSMDGYAYRSALDNVSFSKEIVFSVANWGWYPYFTYENQVLAVQHFSFAGYYAETSTRNSDGTWSTQKGSYIKPDAFNALSEEAGGVYIVEKSLSPLQLAESNISLTISEAYYVEITSGNGSFTVTSNNSDVATAVIDGSSVVVTAVNAGTAIITVTDTQSGETATIEVTVTEPISLCPDNNHPHMIDLGLPSGTMWSCCNVDTSHPENQKPSNNGGYYAWGETEEKDNYTWATYIHCDGSEETCHYLGESIVGTQYDVAHVRWGDQWQMATVVQNQELVDNCTYSWTTIDGVSGGLFTGSNGASIFFPAAGYRTQNGYNNLGINAWCWTGIAYSENNYDSRTFVLSRSNQSTTGRGSRYYGRSVRPVSTVSAFAPLQLSESSVEIMKGENTTIEITSGNGNYTVNSSNSSVAKATITDSSVTVSAVSEGTATITVTDTKSGYQETVEVTVIVHLQLSKSSAEITLGENTTINITGNGNYTVECSDETVATSTIDGNSVTITAVSVGSATLTVTDTKTGETVDIAVTVHTPLAISENSLSIIVGDADVVVQLTGGSGTCSVTSSNTNVVRGTFQALEDGGNVTVHAVGKGTATLTVKDTNTGYQVTIEVTAKDHLQLAKSSVDITIGGGTTVNISKGNDSYTVSSSNQDIATAVIDGSSVSITALGVGTATITVTDTDTDDTATIDVTVHTPLAISENSLSIMVGDADVVVQLTGGSGTCSVTSSNTNVVRGTFQALEDGANVTVHAVGKGTAILTVKDTKTGYQVTIEVTAKDHLQLAKSSVDITIGGGTIVNISKGNDSYSVSSSNQDIATAVIDGSSVSITALGVGTATITVTDTDTDDTATIDVTVHPPLALSKSAWSMIADYDDDEVVRLTGGSGTYTIASSNTNSATATLEALEVGGNITVHAVSSGIATITVSDTKTGDQIAMEVTVLAPLALSKTILRLYPNYDKESVRITSGNGSYTTVSSNESVATAMIDGSSVKITAIKKGTATITVTDTQTGLTASVAVAVIDHSNDPLTPSSPLPSNGAVNVGTSGTFAWLIPAFNGGKGTHFELYLDTDSRFRNTNEQPYLSGEGNNCDFTGLKAGTKYYWKVKVYNENGQYTESATWSFTTREKKPVTAALRGDVNGDNSVTITDVMLMSNYIIGAESNGFIISNADVNEDGDIGISDIMIVVDIVLNGDIPRELCMVIWQKDGSQVQFRLAEEPKITYIGDNVIVKASSTVEYEFQSIRKMTFERRASALLSLLKPFTFDGETVTFLPSDKDMHVKATRQNGEMVKDFVVKKGEIDTLPLKSSSANDYVINVNGVTYKIKTK